ncbi:MAG: CDP-alcohol phosphatidyltransferase family protein [Acidobacteria bacterium]|nr:CDP-alcohol phosphatidyltransferase family protein [Acidobacteriota bacterium]
MAKVSTEVRVQTSLLAAIEKRLLIYMAERMPAAVNSDHLTALGGIAILLAGLCYWAAPGAPPMLIAAIVLLAINWFGDSMDGTLARVRRHERPRYGFYVDHVLDAVGILCLMGGLILGGQISPGIGVGFLIAYYLLTIEIALATHTVGTFRISYWKVGPTELRILLAIGTLQLLRSPTVALAGQRYLLFDVAGAIAIGALALTFAVSMIQNTRILYRREPLPRSQAIQRRSCGAGGSSLTV